MHVVDTEQITDLAEGEGIPGRKTMIILFVVIAVITV